MAYDALRVDGTRLLADLDALAKVGGTDDGGVHRPAFSEADVEVRGWLLARAADAGLAAHADGAGNVSVRLPAADPAAPTVAFGSHLDTVPNGGRFDGALGVVAALEVLRTVHDAELALPAHLEAISFSDEEGTWSPLFGSRALAGELHEADFAAARGGGEAFDAVLARAGITRPGALAAARPPGSLKAWVEVHVEQGTRLEEAGASVGVVTAITGIASYWLTFVGRADHAGTAPMGQRLDALRGVASFLSQSRELVMNRFPQGVMNCGIVEASPGAFNIVPERARLALEFRHHNPATMEAMREALLSLALHVVEVEGLALDVEQVGVHAPAPMSRTVSAAIEQAASGLGLRSLRLPSYAGHDTQIMAAITEAGMFFVPSAGGHSHSPREYTSPEDCVRAGNVLLHTVLALATE